jgi:hypothetical protein
MHIGKEKQIRKEIMPTAWEASRVFAELRMHIAFGLIEDEIIFIASYGDFIVRRIKNCQNNLATFEIKKILREDKLLGTKPKKVIFWDEIEGSV